MQGLAPLLEVTLYIYLWGYGEVLQISRQEADVGAERSRQMSRWWRLVRKRNRRGHVYSIPGCLSQLLMCNPPIAPPATLTAESDILSEILRSVQPRGWIAEESIFTAPWGLRGNGESAVFFYVVQGSCWFELDGVEAAQSINQGDLVAIMPGCGFCLCDSRDSSTIPLEEVFGARRAKRSIPMGGEGCSTTLLCGGLLFDQRRGIALAGSVPSSSIVRGVDGRALPWLEQILRRIVHERAPARPGWQSIVDHLVQVIFIETIRASVATPPHEWSSGLAALADPDIGLALRLMHTAPHARWTVTALADRVGMSRSVFAARFKTLTSRSPMQYLFDYRMGLACDLIAEGRSGGKQIAAKLGYATRDAFSVAFKRWSGLTPKAYRRRCADRAVPEDDGTR